MAIVGSAHIVVRAITDKVDQDIRKGFSGTSTTAHKAGLDMGNALTRGLGIGAGKKNAFLNLSNQLKELYPEAERAADGVTSLMRTGYTAQAGIGALVGSIGALIGGLGALIGVAGGAAGALVAVAGAGIAAKVGMSVAGFAMKGISQAAGAATKATGGYSKSLKQLKFDAEEAALGVDRAGLNLEKARETMLRTQDLPSGNRTRREAELAYEEAELAYRRAKAAKAEGAKEGAGGGGADPYAGLTPTQKSFAKYLASLKKDLDDLKEAAAAGFLPLLKEQMERLIGAGVLDILKKRFFDIGEGMGKAAEKFTDVFLSGDNLKNFDKVLENIAAVLPQFGTIVGNVFSGFLSTLVAADPLTRRFVDFLEKKSASFANFLSVKQQSGELEKFFKTAGDLAAKFGGIFGNVFGALGTIIKANFAPGSGGWMLLDWLDKVTLGFKNMDIVGLQSYFKGAADNFISMGNALGGAMESVIKAGSNPAIKQFWDILDSGSYAFNQIIIGSVESAPALGRLLQTMTEIIAVFSDSDQVTQFFDVLNYMANGAAEILKAIKPLIDFAGPILATVSAIGLLIGGFTKLGLVTIGFLGKALAGFGIALPGALGRAAVGAGGTAGAMTAAAGSMQAAAVAMTQLAVASGATIPAMAGAAATTGAAGTAAAGSAGGFRAATAAMLAFNASNPIGWVVLAVTAIVALGVAMAGIHAANMDKATDAVTASMERGAGAADVWGDAILAVADGPGKQAITTMDGMKETLTRLGKVQKGYMGASTTLANSSTTALADSFGAMGRSLANVATTDLVSAQKSMKKFASETGLSNSEVIIAIDEMDEYKDALKKQAEALGITIGDTDTYAGKLKLAQFAMGEGEIATRTATAASKEFADSVKEVAKQSIDATGPLKQTSSDTMKWAKAQAEASGSATDTWKDYWDGQKFSIDKYLDDLEAQKKATDKWAVNLAKVSSGATSGVKEFLKNLGIGGADLVASLTDGINDAADLARLEKIYGSAGTAAGKGYSNGFVNSLPKGQTLQQLMNPSGKKVVKDGGYISSFANGGLAQKFAAGGAVSGLGTARSDSIPAMLSNGEFVINAAATSRNRELLEAVNSNKSVALAPTINLTVNPSPGMDERELAEIVSRKIAFEMRKGRY